MLKASPVRDKIIQKEYCRLCDVPYRENCFAYSQTEKGNLIAICQFDILKEHAVITDISMVKGLDDDLEALIILGRAVMNFLDLTNVKKCVFNHAGEHDEKMARLLGFKKENDIYSVDLEGFFESKCHHDK